MEPLGKTEAHAQKRRIEGWRRCGQPHIDSLGRLPEPASTCVSSWFPRYQWQEY